MKYSISRSSLTVELLNKFSVAVTFSSTKNDANNFFLKIFKNNCFMKPST